MADLFSVTAPLLARFPGGRREVMVACFSGAGGIVYFRPFCDSLPVTQGAGFIEGEPKGEGPWKIGDVVVTVLGCQGTDPDEADEFARWKSELEMKGKGYPAREYLEQLAREAGLLV